MYLTLNRARRVYPRPLAANGNAVFSPALDNLFEGFFNSVAAANASTALPARFDLTEKGDAFVARIEIPGVAKEDIDVQIDGAEVRVKAEAKTAEEAKEEAKDGERVLHSNRIVRSWSRSFTLPVEVADDRAEAVYENGVLTLTLPKQEVVQPKRLAIK